MARVIVVDEDSFSRKHAAQTLRRLDHTVRTVSQADAALAALRQIRFDAVLLSASLPGVTPTAFLDALHRDALLAEVPVVVTAVTPRAAIDSIQAGARGCIRKPIDAGGAMSALSAVAAHRRGNSQRQHNIPSGSAKLSTAD